MIKIKTFDFSGVIVPNDDAWIYDYLGLENVCPSKIDDFLSEADGDDVQININSQGGDLYNGVNIYSKLRDYSGNVEIHVTGLAASAASIIAMAGKCLMSHGSTLMIHNALQQSYGDKNEHNKTSVDLAVHDKAIAQVYADKTGIEVSEILKMMNEETFIDAETAIEMKFADGYINTSKTQICNTFGSGLLPQSVLDEMRQRLRAEQQTQDGIPVNQLQKRLNLLRR